MKTEIQDVTAVRFYLPDAAGNIEPDGTAETVLETLKKRSAEHFGGYTEYSNCSGGWLGKDGIVEENVTVLEVLVNDDSDIGAETFAKVNARWILRETNENTVLAKVGKQTVVVE